MGQEEPKFVAIRMIAVDYGKTNDPVQRRAIRQNFENWMIDTFLDEMGVNFQPGLERITFLRGNKKEKDETDTLGDKPVQSYQNAKPNASVARADSTDAGANADFAWITYWTNRGTNRSAWRSQRPPAWSTLWSQFRAKCQQKTHGRPKHGPPYDSVGGPVASSGNPQFGAGAGSLVEGFEVVWEWEQSSQAQQSMGNPGTPKHVDS